MLVRRMLCCFDVSIMYIHISITNAYVPVLFSLYLFLVAGNEVKSYINHIGYYVCKLRGRKKGEHLRKNL